MRPRDEAASAVLRALTDEQAATVLHAGAEALAEHAVRWAAAKAAEAATAGNPAGAGNPAPAAPALPSSDEVLRGTVSRCLPDLTEPHLLTGVSALVRAVLRLAESTAAFMAPPVEQKPLERQRVAGMYLDYSPRHADDKTLREATKGLAHQQGWWGGGQVWNAVRQIRAVNHVLSGKPADGRPLPERSRTTGAAEGWWSDEFTIPAIGVLWPSLLDVLRPLAYRAASPVVSDAHREALLVLFEVIADGRLAAADGAALREIVLSEPQDNHERLGQVLRRDGRTVVVLGCQQVDRANGRVHWLALDHDPSGAFGAIAHFVLEREKAHPPVFPANALAAVTKLIRDKGAAPGSRTRRTRSPPRPAARSVPCSRRCCWPASRRRWPRTRSRRSG